MLNNKKIIIIAAAAVLLIVVLAIAASSKKNNNENGGENGKETTESTKKPTDSQDETNPEFVVTTADLGVIGEDTGFPVKMTLNNLGVMTFTLTSTNYTDWKFEAEGFTVSKLERSSEKTETAEPADNTEAEAETSSVDTETVTEKPEEDDKTEIEPNGENEENLVEPEKVENVEPDKGNDKSDKGGTAEDKEVEKITLIYNVYYGVSDTNDKTSGLENGVETSEGETSEGETAEGKTAENGTSENKEGTGFDSNAAGASDTETTGTTGTGETLEKEIYLVSGQAGLRYTFRLKITDGLITELLESKITEEQKTYDKLDFYDEISVMVDGVKFPAGTLIVNYDVLQLEEKEEAERMKRLILKIGSVSYKLAITNKDEYFNPANVKKLLKSIMKEKGLTEASNVKDVTIGETTATLYRFGEVSVAIFTTQDRNFFLFIDDDSKDFAAIEAAAKLFIEV